MKALNTMKFVSNAIEELAEYKAVIAAAETFEDAKNKARMMMGYINSLTHKAFPVPVSVYSTQQRPGGTNWGVPGFCRL